MTHRNIEVDPSPYNVTQMAFWKQTVDRVLKTAIQALLVFVGGGVALDQIAWSSAGTSILVTVVATLLMSLASAKLYETQSFSVDLAQRAARTFVATFAGAVAALSSLAGADWNSVIALAASATILSVVTSLGSRNIGVPNTASLLRGAEAGPIA